MTKLKPFRTRTNEEGDIVCEFQFFATEKGVWQTELDYDPLQEKVVNGRCECPAQKFQSIKKEDYKCKHQKIAEKILNKFKEQLK